MDCDSAKISAYHDNELPEAQRAALDAHLLTCAACARELEELRRITRLCEAARNAPRVRPAPITFREVRQRQSAIRLEKVLIGMAAAIMLICGSWLVIEPERPKNSISLDAMVLHLSDNRDSIDPLQQDYARGYSGE